MLPMSEKWIEVEGADLAQALEKACATLGVGREDLEYDFDLNHYKGGAATTRILAGKRDPRAASVGREIEERVKSLLEAENLDAQVSVRVTLFAVEVELRAPAPGVSDEPFRALTGTLEEELAEQVEGRDLRMFFRGYAAEERFVAPRRERRDGFSRGPRRPRSDDGAEDRSERDENLRRKVRSAIKRVMNGGGPTSLNDLNSYERRLVHLVVREFKGVVSHSVGEGIRKDVLIERSNPEG